MNHNSFSATTAESIPRPLDGILVIALEQAVAAPYCTSRLADAGARVIKIERPEGDFARGYDRTVNGESSYWIWINRGKESVSLNLKDNGDILVLRAMLSKPFLWCHNDLLFSQICTPPRI